MACTFYSDREIEDQLREGIRRLNEQVNELTRMLCEVTREVGVRPGVEGHEQWWAEHQRRDAERKAIEEEHRATAERAAKVSAEERAITEAALAKLSPEERRLLKLP